MNLKKRRRKMKKEMKENIKKLKLLPYDSTPLAGISFLINDSVEMRSYVDNLEDRCKDPNILHRFRIYDIQNFGRNYIMRSMLESIYPVELTPRKCVMARSVIYFLAANCVDAMAKFIENGLKIPHFINNYPFKVDIIANFCKAKSLNLDNLKALSIELNKRFKVETNSLFLDGFSRTDEMLEYYPLYQSSTLMYILEQSSKFYSLKKLSLKRNDIKCIKDLSPLKCLQIEILDLSSNEISSIDDLQGLKMLDFLTELYLEKNPMCSRYDSNTYNYVTDVKSVCNCLQKLDGYDVSSPSFKKNFLRSPDANDLCTQFLEHFFTLYDSKDKQNLADLYDKNAVLSVSSKIVPNQKSSHNVRLTHYGIDSPYIVVGITYIMKFFKGLGRIYHDPYSFVCDLTMYTPTFAVLSIGGVFRESNQILGFSRTFVLKGTGEEYCITNDQLLVYNALDYQLDSSFSYPRQAEWTGDLLPYYPEQYGQVDDYIESVTGMKKEFTRKILKLCKYDPEKALVVFSDLLINDKIPREAFLSRNRTNKLLRRSFYDEIKEKALQIYGSATLKTAWDTMNLARMEDIKAHIPINRIKDKKILLKPIIERWRAKREAMPQIFENEEDFPVMHCDPEPPRVPQVGTDIAAFLTPFQQFQELTHNQSLNSMPYHLQRFSSFDEPVEPTFYHGDFDSFQPMQPPVTPLNQPPYELPEQESKEKHVFIPLIRSAGDPKSQHQEMSESDSALSDDESANNGGEHSVHPPNTPWDLKSYAIPHRQVSTWSDEV